MMHEFSAQRTVIILMSFSRLLNRGFVDMTDQHQNNAAQEKGILKKTRS